MTRATPELSPDHEERDDDADDERAELAALAVAARDGDRAAFDELVGARHAGTYTLALRLTGNEEDARDVTQETYLRAFRGLPTFRGDSQFTTWLYRITANWASTYLGRAAATATTSSPTTARARRRATRCRSRAPADAADLRDRLIEAARPTSPRAAGRRRAPRRLRAAPRGDRRGARASARRPPRSACTVPGTGCGSELFPETTRSTSVRCDERGRRLSESPTGRLVCRRAAHATSSGACAARPSWSSTVGSCGPCAACAPRSSSRRRACSTDILADLEEAGERTAIRSHPQRHRVAYVGGLAAATAAGAAGAIVVAVAGSPAAGVRLGRPDRSRYRLWRPAAGAPLGSHRSYPAEGSGSIGRAPVSKTGGWGFESLLPCHPVPAMAHDDRLGPVRAPGTEVCPWQ